MAVKKWGSQYSIGDPEIDEQHQVLFEMTNRISCTIARRQLNITEELSALMLYASEHFYSEEVLMSRIGYPGLDAHRLGHAAFQWQLMGLADRIQLAGTLDWDCLGTLTTTWMEMHVLKGDMDIRRFLLKTR